MPGNDLRDMIAGARERLADKAGSIGTGGSGAGGGGKRWRVVAVALGVLLLAGTGGAIYFSGQHKNAVIGPDSRNVGADGANPFSPVFVEHDIDGPRCDAIKTKLLNQERPAQCLDVFYATSRLADDDNNGDPTFGMNFEQEGLLNFGRAAIAVPFVSELKPESFCAPYKVFGIETGAQKCERLTKTASGLQRCSTIEAFGAELEYWWLIGSLVRTCAPADPDTDLKSEYNTEKFEYISEEEYIDYIAQARVTTASDGVSEKANSWEGLTGIEAVAPDGEVIRDYDGESSVFIQSIDEALDAEDKTVLLYIHGYKTTFESSLMGAAHLTANLNPIENSDELSEVEIDTGLPIVFSWPTLLGSDRSDVFLEYYEYLQSQLRAHLAAQDLRKLLQSFRQSDVEKINIVAHSMGNRVLAEALTGMSEPLKNRNSKTISFRVIMAAADVGQSEYRNVLAAKDQKLLDPTTIYFSRSDQAMWLSFGSQLAKWFGKPDDIEAGFREINSATIGLIAGRLTGQVFVRRLTAIGVPIEVAELLLQHHVTNTPLMQGLLDRSGADANLFFSEDQCRVGSQVEFLACFPFIYEHPEFDTIDASNFFGSDYNHSYADNSPMVLGDIKCAIRGGSPR